MAKKGYVVGSGNVFADLGHPRPAEALAKAELARKIGTIIERRGLTQAAAAALLEDRPAESLGAHSRTAGRVLARSTCAVSRPARERRRDRREASGASSWSSARDGRLRNARGALPRAQYVSLPGLSCGSGGS